MNIKNIQILGILCSNSRICRDKNERYCLQTNWRYSDTFQDG